MTDAIITINDQFTIIFRINLTDNIYRLYIWLIYIFMNIHKLNEMDFIETYKYNSNRSIYKHNFIIIEFVE